MKKIISASAVIFLMGISMLYAQDKAFRFGFRLSPNIAWMAPDTKDYENNGSSAGFGWGFIGDFTLAENYYVATGFSYDYLNGSLDYPHILTIPGSTQDTTGIMTRKYHLRYLQIPLAIKMRTNKFGDMSFFGQIGLGTSFNLRSKSDDEFRYGANNSVKVEAEEDIKDEVAFLREDLLFGIGAEYFIDESTSIVVGLNFNNCLSNVLKDENNVSNEKQKALMHFFSLNLGVIF